MIDDTDAFGPSPMAQLQLKTPEEDALWRAVYIAAYSDGNRQCSVTEADAAVTQYRERVPCPPVHGTFELKGEHVYFVPDNPQPEPQS